MASMLAGWHLEGSRENPAGVSGGRGYYFIIILDSDCPVGLKASAGLCLMPVVFSGCYPLLELINAVTGWDMSMSEVLKTGARIQTLRQLFNIREGISPSDFRLPDRMAGIPPQSSGPLEGVTIDIDTLTKEYREAMEWDPKTGKPSDSSLKRLGLLDLVS